MQEIHCNLPLQSVQLKVESYNKDRGSMMTANRRPVRKRRSKHKGSMKIITLIVLVLCGVFGVFTWQNTQKSEQYALVQENLQQQIDDEEENQKAIEEQAEYQKTDAYIEDLAREKLGLVHEDEIIFKKK